MPPKVVFDTNIFISAIIFGGNPRVCLEMARQGTIRLYTTRAILLELATKLHKKFQWSQEEVEEVIVGISKFATIVSPEAVVELIKTDPPDNRVFEAAKDSAADFIISGDRKHLLSLREFERIKILSAGEFIKLFRA